MSAHCRDTRPRLFAAPAHPGPYNPSVRTLEPEKHKPSNWWSLGEINPSYDRSTWKRLYRCVPGADDFPAQECGRGRGRVGLETKPGRKL